jgi:putative inorganic carbon (hco3(-)) transporter
MNTIWQYLTLANLPLYQWRTQSYLGHLVGPLQHWRKASWVMQWANELGAVLACLVLGLAPFVPNELTGVLLLACGGYWLLLTLSEETYSDRQQVGFTPIHLLVLLYFGIVTVATAVSPVKLAAFAGWQKFTLYLAFFVFLAQLFRSTRIRNWIIAFYLHISLIVSAYGIRQLIFGAEALATWSDPTAPDANEIRIYSFLGNPNLLAAYLIPAIGLSAMAILTWRGRGPKLLAALMLGLNLICLYFTRSRGAWIGLILMGVVLMILVFSWLSDRIPTAWRKLALPVALGSFVALLVIGFTFVEPLRLRVLSIVMGRGDSSNNFRRNVWDAVIEMIQDRPVLGIGPGNTAFNAIYPLYQRARYTALSAYSIPLEIAVESGLIGLFSFVWLTGIVFTQGWLQLQRLRNQNHNPEAFWLIGSIVAMVGLLGQGLFDTVWYRPEVNTLWWMLVAIVASYYTPLQPTARSANLAE